MADEDEFEMGTWWVEGNPTQPVGGAFRSLQDGWLLSTAEKLSSPQRSATQLRVQRSTTVHGNLGSKAITLLNAYYRDGKSGFTAMSNGEALVGSTQRWWVTTLIRNGHVGHDQLYSEASLQVQFLDYIFTESGLDNPHGYDQPPDLTGTCGDGSAIAIGARLQDHVGRRRRQSEEVVRVWYMPVLGKTFADLHADFVIPVHALVSIVMGEELGIESYTLRPIDEARAATPLVADWTRRERPARNTAHKEPLFTSSDVELGVLLPRWMELAQKNPIPTDAAQFRRSTATLQSDVVLVVNALESLHATLHGTNAQLTDKLVEVAEPLGTRITRWLFQKDMPGWAVVAAEVRNVLSHNLTRTHRVAQDEEALILLERATRNVLQLRMLLEAGVSEQQLLTCVQRSRRFQALADQQVADWTRLADTIEAALAPGRSPRPRPV